MLRCQEWQQLADEGIQSFGNFGLQRKKEEKQTINKTSNKCDFIMKAIKLLCFPKSYYCKKEAKYIRKYSSQTQESSPPIKMHQTKLVKCAANALQRFV